jgi:hypothetical protein
VAVGATGAVSEPTVAAAWPELAAVKKAVADVTTMTTRSGTFAKTSAFFKR